MAYAPTADNLTPAALRALAGLLERRPALPCHSLFTRPGRGDVGLWLTVDAVLDVLDWTEAVHGDLSVWTDGGHRMTVMRCDLADGVAGGLSVGAWLPTGQVGAPRTEPDMTAAELRGLAGLLERHPALPCPAVHADTQTGDGGLRVLARSRADVEAWAAVTGAPLIVGRRHPLRTYELTYTAPDVRIRIGSYENVDRVDRDGQAA